jgi:hypothetical protein
MKTKILTLVGLLLAVMVPKAHPSADSENLKGLRGVRVLVESVKPDLEKEGVTEEQLTNRVEVKLRQAGIEVITSEEYEKLPLAQRVTVPALYVKVEGIRIMDLPLYAYCLSLEVLDGVIFLRDKQMKTLAGTWMRHAIGYSGLSNLREIYNHLGDLADGFINDYLAANPK